MTNASEAILTSSEAGARLSFSSVKIRQLCEKGAFPNAYRLGLGGHWRIPEADVEALMERMRPKVVRRPPAGL